MRGVVSLDRIAPSVRGVVLGRGIVILWEESFFVNGVIFCEKSRSFCERSHLSWRGIVILGDIIFLWSHFLWSLLSVGRVVFLGKELFLCERNHFFVNGVIFAKRNPLSVWERR